MLLARTDIEANLSTVLDLYQADNGSYPTTEQGLKALIEKPTTDPVPATIGSWGASRVGWRPARMALPTGQGGLGS